MPLKGRVAIKKAAPLCYAAFLYCVAFLSYVAFLFYEVRLLPI